MITITSVKISHESGGISFFFLMEGCCFYVSQEYEQKAGEI